MGSMFWKTIDKEYSCPTCNHSTTKHLWQRQSMGSLSLGKWMTVKLLSISNYTPQRQEPTTSQFPTTCEELGASDARDSRRKIARESFHLWLSLDWDNCWDSYSDARKTIEKENQKAPNREGQIDVLHHHVHYSRLDTFRPVGYIWADFKFSSRHAVSVSTGATHHNSRTAKKNSG